MVATATTGLVSDATRKSVSRRIGGLSDSKEKRPMASHDGSAVAVCDEDDEAGHLAVGDARSHRVSELRVAHAR